MLALKPNCQCCDSDIAANSANAFICTFECTYCEACATGRLNFVCPACGGNLVVRPTRPPEKLAKFPASTQRAGLNV
jgi:uncharacterized protein